MVNRVLNIFYREVKGLHQAAYVLALFALASQILAIVRDRLLANQFGAGLELDLYYAAFRIPDLLFVLFASVLSVYVLLPFVTRARTFSETEGARVLSQVYSIFLVGYTFIALVIFIISPYIMAWLYPGFSVESLETVTTLTRILLLQPFLLGLSSLCGVVTQLQHRFVIYALSPLLYNIGIIFGATVLFAYFGLPGIAAGVILGAFFHLLIQWPLVHNSSLTFSFTRSIDRKLFREIASVAFPRALTLSLSQIQILFLFSIASSMTIGSLSILQFAFNLQSVPLAIIGMSYSVAAFPTLTELLAQKKTAEFNTYVMTALRHIIFWSVPIVALVIVLRAQIVRVLLGSGSFDWVDTRLTAAALGLFVISLTAQALALLIVRAFYAGGYTKLPLILTAFGTVIGSGFAYMLYRFIQVSPDVAVMFSQLFRLEGVVGVEVLMLPLGYTLGVLIQVFLMLTFLARTFDFKLRELYEHLLQSLIAGTVGGFVAYATLMFVVEGVNQDRFVGIFLQGITAGVLGVIAVVTTYRLLGSTELHEIYMAFRSRIFKTDVITPQPEIL